MPNLYFLLQDAEEVNLYECTTSEQKVHQDY